MTISITNNPINVLIVENELLTLYSLKKALETLSNSKDDLNFKIVTAKDYDTALFEINKFNNVTSINLALLNINIPPSNTKKLMFVEDLSVSLRTLFPKIKIIVFASHCDNYKINSVLKTINPEGFLIKSDFDFKKLVQAIKTVLLEGPYYSNVILRLIRRRINNDIVLDKTDKKILYYLSKGTKTKDLPNILYLSKGGIERRKRNLKEIFDIDNGDDKMLLKRAEENGFI